MRDPGDGGNRPGAWPNLDRRLDVSERTCAHCGRELPSRARRYCKDPDCARQRKAAYMREFYRRRGDRTEGGCTAAGCDKPIRAKGLCVTHYNRNLAQRHPKVTVACTYCGQPTEKMRDNRRLYRFCSLLCRDLWRLEQTDGDPMVAARAASTPRTGPRSCPLPADHPARWYGQTMPLDYRTCAWCGEQFCTGRHILRAYCSETCKAKAKRMRRRSKENARSYGQWTWAEFMYIAQRFDYRCAYCNERPDGQLAPDHVVPISKGGPNTTTNLLPSCTPCNSDKRDLLLHEWDEDRRRRGLSPRATTWASDDTRYFHLTSLAA